MFCARYFARRFFAARYWAKIGAAAPVVTDGNPLMLMGLY